MNEQNMKLLQVKKSCKTARKVSLVFTIMMDIAAIVSLAAAIIVLVMKDTINSTLLNNADHLSFENTIGVHGLLSISVNLTNMINDHRYASVIATYCFFGAFVAAMLAIIFGMLLRIFSTVEKSDSPFSEDVLKSMKKTFISLSVLAILFVGVGAGLILALFLWCIYTIMDYGMTLQLEVDDTI